MTMDKVSVYTISLLDNILKNLIKNNESHIHISTNLRKGFPLENINKIAGPFAEAWLQEKIENICLHPNEYIFSDYEGGARLDFYDIKFHLKNEAIGVDRDIFIDTKSAALDIPTSGLGSNLTSYIRIRNIYLNDSSLRFIMSGLKHRVTQSPSGLIIEGFNVFDLMYVADKELSFNKTMGSQLQIR